MGYEEYDKINQKYRSQPRIKLIAVQLINFAVPAKGHEKAARSCRNRLHAVSEMHGISEHAQRPSVSDN